jgi:nitroimidazol reductase NimA-like FMN-containing flavoprotein (pyridoxamine 5'-phosphate oxidase superfamily)
MGLDLPRRKDRAVTNEVWMKQLLRSAKTGVLAIVDGDIPYQNPNLFVYDETEHAVYLHRMGPILPAARAFGFSAEYDSLIVTGGISQVQGEGQKTEILRAFMHKYAPELEYDVDYEGVRPKDLPLTAVNQLKVDAWMGKSNPGGRHAP